MEEAQFLEKFREQLEDPNVEGLSLEMKFREIPTWDSLTGMAVQMMIKDEYASAIPDTDFQQSSTIRDLYNLMLKNRK
jgi:acyl carrier protein